MFNIKEEKSYKMSFKTLPVKIQWSSPPPPPPSHPLAPGADRVNEVGLSEIERELKLINPRKATTSSDIPSKKTSKIYKNHLL